MVGRLNLPPKRASEIAEEFSEHLEDYYEDLIARGYELTEARGAVIAQLTELVKGLGVAEQETARSQSTGFVSGKLLTELIQDLRYGMRIFRRKPGFAVTILMTLAVAIGANTTIFSVLNASVLRSLPYEHAEQLAMIWQMSADKQQNVVTYPAVADWRIQNRSFESLATYRPYGFTLTGVGDAEKITAAVVSPEFLAVLRVQPLYGRGFLSEEGQRGSEKVVLINHGFWLKRFGGDAHILGQSIWLSGDPFKVIGILPPTFRFPDHSLEPDVLVTTALERVTQNRNVHVARVIGRLKSDVNINDAQNELAVITNRLQQQFSDEPQALVVSLHDQLVGKFRRPLSILLAAVACVLLLSCVNVSALLMAHGASRVKELRIRRALGADRWRITRQLLSESLLLSFCGGGAGLLLAIGGVALFADFIPLEMRRLNGIAIDSRTLAFTAFISLTTGIVFGLAPAWKVLASSANPNLNERGVGSVVLRKSLSRSIVAFQIALSFVLLVGAGLLMKSFLLLERVNTGFNSNNVLTFRVSLSNPKYKQEASRAEFLSQLQNELKTLPGVSVSAFGTPIPFSGVYLETPFTIEGQPESTTPSQLSARIHVVSASYFNALSIPIKTGRPFLETDQKNGTGVVLISQALAERYWPGQNPLGQRISGINLSFDDNEPKQWEIIGVVDDVKDGALNLPPAPEIYLPHSQIVPSWGYFVIRSVSDPLTLAVAVRQRVSALDPAQPITDVTPLEQMVSASTAQPRFYAFVLSLFATAALALSVLGIYGLMSHLVIQRTHEIGIRMALGARRTNVSNMVIKAGMIPTLIGLSAGLIGVFVVTRILGSLLFEVSATDPSTLISMSAGLLFVALIACYIPARRATKVDPLIALRHN
jgi:putative ABC transport system permease protein